MRKVLFVSCCLAALGLIACGSDSSTGEPGPQGPAEEQGTTGSKGSTGESGSPGATGSQGPSGSQGPAGDQGEVGEQGQVGDIACGDSLIPAAEWHTACGSSVGSCKQGQVQCRLKSVDGELVPYRTCFGEVAPAANSGLCHLDADCDGVKDNTVGAGDNVTLVKQVLTLEGKLAGSRFTFALLKSGLCRNAKKHCLLPDAPNTSRMDANGEGVLWSDFVADPKEADMGFECVSGQDVRTWECTVGDDGVARVTCSGPRGL